MLKSDQSCQASRNDDDLMLMLLMIMTKSGAGGYAFKRRRRNSRHQVQKEADIKQHKGAIVDVREVFENTHTGQIWI